MNLRSRVSRSAVLRAHWKPCPLVVYALLATSLAMDMLFLNFRLRYALSKHACVTLKVNPDSAAYTRFVPLAGS